MPELEPPVFSQLLAAAREATTHAYAPYSNFFVGAAVLTEDGRTFTGCNVENASYGLTICAERHAIGNAVAASKAPASEVQGKVKFRAVVVATASDAVCSPCGACRQFIAEFGGDILVYYMGPEGYTCRTSGELLPDGFRL